MINTLRGAVGRLLLALLLLAAPRVWAQSPVWQMAMTMGGNTSQVNATATDGAGNVYIAGAFTGTVNFGGISLTSQGPNFDAFVAKWSPASYGFVWAQRAGGTGTEMANGVAVEGNGVYIVGEFSSTPAAFGSTLLTNSGTTPMYPQSDIFVAKLVDAGTSASFAWAQGIGSSQYGRDAGNAIVASGTSVYIAGTVGPAARFGTLALAGGSTMFVAKLTDAGSSSTFSWVQPAGGGDAEDNATALALNGNNLYVAGYFYNGATFGSIALTSTSSCRPCRYRDMFVAKLVDGGTTPSFGWAERTPGEATALDVDGSNVYVAGVFNGTTTFGGTVLTSNGTSQDIFVAKLSDLGSSVSFGWAQRAGSSYLDWVTGIKAKVGSVYITGFFGDDIVLGNTTLVSAGGREVYVAKLTDAGATSNFVWAQRAGNVGTEQGSALALAGSKIYVGGYTLSRTIDFSGSLLTNTGPAGYQVGFFASLNDIILSTTPSASTRQFGLFPNPAHASTIVELPALAPLAGPVKLVLTDALGRTARTEWVNLPATGLRHDLDLTGLAPGLYAVRV
ncbi:MAG: hypothetical protein JWP58_2522 [Hymenobacter sp.]|nr:hypothetical protein [Hymenobacter sp.]